MKNNIILIILILLVSLFIRKNVHAVDYDILKIYDNQQEVLIHSGEKFGQTFKATENNIGIVSIKLDSNNQKVPFNVVFRIKEVGKGDWIYQNNYNKPTAFDYSYYPFGFPPISNSKNKEYYFELELMKSPRNNELKILVNDSNPYEEGTFILNNSIKTNIDMSFKISNEKPFYKAFILDFWQRVMNQKIFFIFYFTIIVTLIFFIIKETINNNE
ncbi:MAG TPA: hypothetical protein VK338_04995 [Candidatus Nitrosocosmicus sp.]|nr:hypothetical protein [Candidatus Nitrosocosmicus sp.]